MLLVIISILFVMAMGGITTIPFSVGLLALSAIFFKKHWVLFLALVLGLFVDLTMMRPLGYSSLFLTIFVFLIWLYERKFEIRTVAFTFIFTFLGGFFYLLMFNGQNILLQAFANSLLAILLFKIINKLRIKELTS